MHLEINTMDTHIAFIIVDSHHFELTDEDEVDYEGT